MPDRPPTKTLRVLTYFSIAAIGLTLAALVAAEKTAGDSAVAYALVFMVAFYFVSLPLHCALAVGAVFSLLRLGFRPVRPVSLYLAIAIVVHVSIAAHIGAFDKLARQWTAWQRGLDMPTQVAFEQAVMPPTDIPAVRAALAAGADPNAVLPGVPLTPLYAAALRGDVPLVKALLEGGADPNQRATIDGAFGSAAVERPYPLDGAAFSNDAQRYETVQELLTHGATAKLSRARLGACATGDLRLYELVVAAGAPDDPDKKGNQCLHLAALRNQPGIAARAIADGADTNAENTAGQRPLDLALIRDSFSAALVIVEGGGLLADPERARRLMDREPADPDQAALREAMRERLSE